MFFKQLKKLVLTANYGVKLWNLNSIFCVCKSYSELHFWLNTNTIHTGHSAVWRSKNLKHHAFCDRCNILAVLLKRYWCQCFLTMFIKTQNIMQTDLVMGKVFYGNCYKKQSWKLEVVVCNVYKKVRSWWTGWWMRWWGRRRIYIRDLRWMKNSERPLL